MSSIAYLPLEHQEFTILFRTAHALHVGTRPLGPTSLPPRVTNLIPKVLDCNAAFPKHTSPVLPTRLCPPDSMSSFFTLPASQRKRKRVQTSSAPVKAINRIKSGNDDESISGSEDSEDENQANRQDVEGSDDEEEDFEDEDPAAKRVRLAERYLANTQKEVLDDDNFDAADVDQENLRRRMGDRLKADTAEGRGKLYRWIGESLDWRNADRRFCRHDGVKKSFTGIAIQGRHVYAVSKDLHIVKWELPEHDPSDRVSRSRRSAKVVGRTRGNKKLATGLHHTAPILCIAVSSDGKFVASGGADNKLIIWEAASLKALKVFTQHRDSVTGLAFRRSTHQLYSASKDRSVKTWSLDELAYVETLFGHADNVVDVAALAQETCVTVGARDRTARFWKVVEEAQLTFRGGGAHGTMKALESLKAAYGHNEEINPLPSEGYHEGSIDRVAMIDDETFVTGSDNGSISLWNITKKKSVFTLPLAHGLDPVLPMDQASAEMYPDLAADEEGRGGRQPRWITALKAIPYSDTFVSGSWDGMVRAWKISGDKRRIEPLGPVGVATESLTALLDDAGLDPASLTNGALNAMRAGIEAQTPIKGVLNDLAIVDVGKRGKDGLLIAAAFGREHRLGRWKEVIDGKDCVVLYNVPLKQVAGEEGHVGDQDKEFGGFIDQ